VPVFGAGELLLSRGDATGRRFCFLMLFAYVSAGLGLLLLTSFLGLRRYLRQRGLAMAPALASSWMITGAMLVVLCLVVSSLLPRPVTPYSLAHLARLRTHAATSSEGRQSDQQHTPDRDAQSKTTAASQAQEGAPNQTVSSEPQSSRTGTRTPAQSQQPSTSPPSVPTPALHLEKWVSHLVAALVLALAAWWFWPELSAALRSLMQGFSGWWSGRTVPLRRPRLPSRGGDATKNEPLPANPFQTGTASQMPLAELVRYSFDALQRWAQARGFTLAENETPIEFAERLAERERVLTREILLLASYYSHVVYANQTPPEESREILKQLWSTIGFRH
jgi:hypothetical protein